MPRTVLPPLVALLAVLACAAPAAAAPLATTAHLDALTTTVTPPAQPGHTSYRLGREPAVGVLWTYAEPDGAGGWKLLGGGAYDPATDTYGQGAYNADDVSRAAVAYVRHWRQTGSAHSRDQAYGLLRGLAYLQTAAGPDAGNVVLWMQPDGTLHPSADPPELPDPSDSGPSYWLARTLWAFGEGSAAFAGHDAAFAAFLRGRLELALDALDRQVLDPRYGRYLTVDGRRWPAWLIVDGADASAEAMYGLAAAVRATGDPHAARDLRRLAEGVAALELGNARRWPYGALLPWAGSRADWHAWGDQMAGALALAARTLHQPRWLRAAVGEAGRFTPHLLAQGGPDNGWLPAPSDRTQIAYGAHATLENLLQVAAATGRDGFRDLAGIAAAWYFGDNAAGQAMYDPATGVTFDGVNADGTVNRNSGAESTIMGLLSALALDADPVVAARARDARRTGQVGPQLVEAESGVLAGGATTVTPAEAWTGESLWSGGAYVALPAGASVSVALTLPVADRYLLQPVYHRLPVARGTVVTTQRLGSAPAGRLDHGGAGPQGSTPWPGYHAIGSLPVSAVPAGAATAEVRSVGTGTAELDALLVQPMVEWRTLAGAGGGQAVLRSFAGQLQTRRIALRGSGPAVARAYTASGELAATVSSLSGSLLAPVVPGGFTVVTR